MRKTFRGKLADNTVERIRLGTNQGLIGYQVAKFQLLPENPSVQNEATFKLFSVNPGTVTTTTIDFTDPTLLGCAVWSNDAAAYAYPEDITVIFDSTKFNQDIYVMYRSSAGGNEMNYYLELEQVTLSNDEATVATLKDMRGRE